jgi:hypothetical protein
MVYDKSALGSHLDGSNTILTHFLPILTRREQILIDRIFHKVIVHLGHRPPSLKKVNHDRGISRLSFVKSCGAPEGIELDMMDYVGRCTRWLL